MAVDVVGLESTTAKRCRKDAEVAEGNCVKDLTGDLVEGNPGVEQSSGKSMCRRGGTRVAKGARVGDEAGVQARRNVGVEVEAESIEQIGHHDGSGRGMHVNQCDVGKAVVAAVVVDTDQDRGVLGDRTQQPEPVDAAGVEGQDDLRIRRDLDSRDQHLSPRHPRQVGGNDKWVVSERHLDSPLTRQRCQSQPGAQRRAQGVTIRADVPEQQQ